MKLVKTASGKRKIKISKSEWASIGKTAGWLGGEQSLTTVIQKLAPGVENVQVFQDGMIEFDYNTLWSQDPQATKQMLDKVQAELMKQGYRPVSQSGGKMKYQKN